METKYEIFGIKDAVYKLKDVIESADGNVSKVLELLGLKPCNFGDSKLLDSIQWRVLDVIDFDDTGECSLEFEESCPLKRSEIVETLIFEGSLGDKIIEVRRLEEESIPEYDTPSGVKMLKGVVWVGRTIYKKGSI